MGKKEEGVMGGARFAGVSRCVVVCVGGLLLAGCGGRRSALLLERFARGPLEEAPTVGQRGGWVLKPDTQTQEQAKVQVTVTAASPEYLKTFFGNKAVFGEFAGANPYFPQHLVFYVKIANRSEGRIRISPAEFAVVDDRGNQYTPLNVDYVTAYAEYRAPMSTATRGLLSEARPGYFGFSVPVGRLVAGKPQGRFALIQQAALQMGLLHPGVVHDGLVAFWSPAQEAKALRLLLTNIKADFDASDFPQTSLEFAFEFHAVD